MTDVLHIVNLDTIGGVEELFCNFIKHPTTHKHHVFVTGGKVHPYFEEALYRNAASVNYEKYLFGLKIPKWMRKLRRDFVLSKHYSHILLWNRFDKIENSAKVIYYEHGASWIHHKGKVAKDYFNSLTSIIANSNAAKRLLTLKWGTNRPIQLLENPLRADISIKKESRAAPHATLRLGCIGRLIPLKGFPIAIQALKLLLAQGYKAELTIAGDGEERESLQKLSEGLPVKFLGAIKDVQHFYDSIDLLLIPSIREPLGLVALEAEARGVPVIAANVDGLPEAVAGPLIVPTLAIDLYPSFGGTLNKLPDSVYDPVRDTLTAPKIVDPTELAKRLRELVENKQEYAELSKRALEFVRNRSTFQQFAEKLLTFLH